MTQFVCPFCGPRELCEFEFHRTVPLPLASPFSRLYERVEQPDSSSEHWQHVGGCRGWLHVVRNPSTGAVLAIRLLDGRS